MPPVVPSPTTVREWIDHRAATSPEAVFLITPESNRRINYAELRQSLVALSAQFVEWNIPPGGVVAVLVGNGLAAAQLFLGSLYNARVFLPLNLAAGEGQLAAVLAHSEATVLITDEDNRHRAEKIRAILDADSHPIRIMEIARDNDISPAAATVDDHPPSADTHGLLIYTSGTTGNPKGIPLSHKNLIAGGDNVAIAHQLRADDRALCVLPLCHINGLCVTVLAPLVSGGSVVLPHKFSAGQFWRIADKYECTWLSVVPTQVSYLLNSESVAVPATAVPATVRFARSASAPLAADVLRQFEQRFSMPMLETMGLSETAAQILANPPPPAVRKPGSPGVPFGCEAVILDDDGQVVAAGTGSGEIAVRGDNVMSGYLKNPQGDAEAFTADGWFLTGDLGRQDDDGYFYVEGRRKELIIKGGENIAPREIDEALLLVDGVLEAAAFARPCPTYGQRVEAAVIIAAGATVSEEALISRCAQEVGEFRSPAQIHFLDELPRGPSGKIQRLHLRKQIYGDSDEK